ncbi:hypothetical protein T484DRAFT_1794298, partial [Baffinella frigidus]
VIEYAATVPELYSAINVIEYAATVPEFYQAINRYISQAINRYISQGWWLNTVPEFYQAIDRYNSRNLLALERHMQFLLANKTLLNPLALEGHMQFLLANKTLLNPLALEGHMQFLLSNKTLLNFPNKHAWFLRQEEDQKREFLLANKTLRNIPNKHAWFLRQLKRTQQHQYGGFTWALQTECRIVIDRSTLAASTTKILLEQSAEQLVSEQLRGSRLQVLWLGEEGEGTGPMREFFSAAPAAFLDPAQGLFKLGHDGRSYHPAPAPSGTVAQQAHRGKMVAFGRLLVAQQAHRGKMVAFGRLLGLGLRHDCLLDVQKMVAFGRLLGLGLRHDCLLDVQFSPVFLWLLLCRTLNDPFPDLGPDQAFKAKMERLEDLDPALHKSLTWLLTTKNALEDMGETFFSITEECAPTVVNEVLPSSEEAKQAPEGDASKAEQAVSPARAVMIQDSDEDDPPPAGENGAADGGRETSCQGKSRPSPSWNLEP